MPPFEKMKTYGTSIIGRQLKDMSNMVMEETFSNTTTYRKGLIYDCNMEAIKEIEFKFLKVKTYTMEKDQVEYMVQFRTGVNPEIDFDRSKDQKHRLGYYIDVLDDNTGLYNKWLIIGKDESEFDKYNVLKCNWEFEWVDADRKYHKCLGCIRDRNSYNSGVWSDGFSTSVENQTAFILPSNESTYSIDYNIRFMITDNMKHPKTYETTKVMDTFPLGTIKVTLKQDHYSEHKDFIGVNQDFFGDDKVHMICDFNKLMINNVEPEQPEEPFNPHVKWHLSDVNNKLYIHGHPQVIKALPNVEGAEQNYEWHLFIDGKEKIADFDPEYSGNSNDTFLSNYLDYIDGTISDDKYYLKDYFDLSIDKDNNTFTIAAINKVTANYMIKVIICDKNKTYYDYAKMEVTI